MSKCELLYHDLLNNSRGPGIAHINQMYKETELGADGDSSDGFKTAKLKLLRIQLDLRIANFNEVNSKFIRDKNLQKIDDINWNDYANCEGPVYVKDEFGNNILAKDEFGATITTPIDRDYLKKYHQYDVKSKYFNNLKDKLPEVKKLTNLVNLNYDLYFPPQIIIMFILFLILIVFMIVLGVSINTIVSRIKY